LWLEWSWTFGGCGGDGGGDGGGGGGSDVRWERGSAGSDTQAQSWISPWKGRGGRRIWCVASCGEEGVLRMTIEGEREGEGGGESEGDDEGDDEGECEEVDWIEGIWK